VKFYPDSAIISKPINDLEPLISDKTSIFISHATPQDNDVVRWLAAKLELAGYQVWHDLERLKGGDIFWDKIERAIREESFRMVAVVSNIAIQKPNVQNEWEAGLVVEKSIPGFVIPITIGGFNFDNLPIRFVRKNALDFTAGWHQGLLKLLDALEDAKAPRAEVDPARARHWLPEMAPSAVLRTVGVERLESTWLRVVSLPPALETAKVLGQERRIKETPQNRAVPWFEHEDRIVGFAKASELVSIMSKSAMLRVEKSADLESFLSGDIRFDGERVRSGEAKKRAAHLLRQACELALEAKGFPFHMQSNERKVHYVSPELTGGIKGKVAFTDFDGKLRKRGLNGQSPKNEANWHFGVSINPSFDEPRRIELRPAVVFTDFEGKPLEAAAQQRLRMGFCRNWFNDRWRGFLRCFLALLAQGASEIKIPVGSGRFMVLEASPLCFDSPVGLSDGAPEIDDSLAVVLDEAAERVEDEEDEPQEDRE
jgi:hypothetical protein